jgi:hypothetical protein
MPSLLDALHSNIRFWLDLKQEKTLDEQCIVKSELKNSPRAMPGGRMDG